MNKSLSPKANQRRLFVGMGIYSVVVQLMGNALSQHVDWLADSVLHQTHGCAA